MTREAEPGRNGRGEQTAGVEQNVAWYPNDPNGNHVNPDGSPNSVYFGRLAEEQRRRDEDAARQRREDEARRWAHEEQAARQRTEEDSRRKENEEQASSRQRGEEDARRVAGEERARQQQQFREGGSAPPRESESGLALAAFVVWLLAVLWAPFQLGLVAAASQQGSLIGLGGWLGAGVGVLIIAATAGAAGIVAALLRRLGWLEELSPTPIAVIAILASLPWIAGRLLVLPVATYFVFVSASAAWVLTGARSCLRGAPAGSGWMPASVAITLVTLAVAYVVGLATVHVGGVPDHSRPILRLATEALRWPSSLGEAARENLPNAPWRAVGKLLLSLAIAGWWALTAFAFASVFTASRRIRICFGLVAMFVAVGLFAVFALGLIQR